MIWTWLPGVLIILLVCVFYFAGTWFYVLVIFFNRDSLCKAARRFRFRVESDTQPNTAVALLESEVDQEGIPWFDVDAHLGMEINILVTAEGLWDISQSILGVAATLLAALVGLQGTFRSIVVWVLVGLPCAIRAKLQEASILKTSMSALIKRDLKEWSGFPSLPYFMSIPSTIDGFSHGNITAEALLTGATYSDELRTLWEKGLFSFLAEPLSCVGYGGLFVCALLMTAIWHTGLLLGTPPFLPAKASLMGFGALERHLEKQAKDNLDEALYLSRRTTTTMQKFSTKFLGEALLFLELTTSFAMAKGIQDDESPTAELTLNVCLSTFAGVMVLKDAIVANSTFPYPYEPCFVLFHIIPCVFASFVIPLKAYTFFRSNFCPNHAWGLTTGCV